MTRLADRLIAFGDDGLGGDVISSLTVPWDGNHVELQHPTLGPIIGAEAATKAARFVVSAEVVDSASSIVSDDASLAIAQFIATPPTPRGWVEFKVLGRVIGIWWDSVDDGRIHFVLFTDGNKQPIFVLENRSISIRSVEQRSAWRVNALFDNDSFELLAGQVVRILICIFAFMNVRRAVTAMPAVASDKLQAARLRRHRLPLLSFNVVKHSLPKNEIQRDEVQCSHGPGVRRHRVIGHLRKLSCGRIEPVWIWVASHWRGDAELGVVLREHHVQRAA